MLVAPLCVQRQRDQEAQQEEDAAAHLRAPPSRQPRGQFVLKRDVNDHRLGRLVDLEILAEFQIMVDFKIIIGTSK